MTNVYGVFWIAAGANHFFNTPFYVSIMPPYLPWHLALVYISGLAEIGLGVLLLFQRWSVLAGWGLIVLLIAVFPANIHMALHPELYTDASPFGLWLRLPLQGVLIAWAYWYTRRDHRSTTLDLRYRGRGFLSFQRILAQRIRLCYWPTNLAKTF